MKIHNPSVTGSLVLSGSLTATGNITTLGTLVAQTLVVQSITSSRDFVTGSTKFGTLSTNTHEFTGSVGITGSLTVAGNILPSADNVYALGASGTRFNNIYSANGVINTLFSSTIRAASNAILFGSNQTNFWGGFIGNSSTSPGNLILTYATSSAGIVDNGYKLQIQQSGSLSGSLFVSGSSIFSGSVGITGSLVVNNNLLVTGSVTAAGAIARSTYINPTLVAAANNDVLVGLDINPTFTNGAFTGVIQRFASFSVAGSNKGSIGWDYTNNILTVNSAGRLDFNAGGGNQMFFNASSTIFQSSLNVNRKSDATSTATQANSYSLVFQSSLWNGSSSLLSYNALRTVASTTVNQLSRFSLFSNTTSTGDNGTEYLSLFNNTGNLLLQNGGTFTDAGFKLDVSGSTRLNGTATIKSASLDYQQNLAVATGSFQTIVSAATGSFRAAIFDYVTFSGSVARAGTLYSTWGGTSVEWFENYTADVNGSTSPVTLQAVLSSGNIVLQAGISGSAWSVRSLVRLL
jgi:hypothetical protein